VASHCATLSTVGEHRHPNLNFRPPAEIRDAAKAAVAGSGWTMNDLLTAFLVAFAADPAQYLRLLAPHRQPVAPAHRPRRKPAE